MKLASLCALGQMGTSPSGSRRAGHTAGARREGGSREALCRCLRRSQELHLRPESHSYLPELGKSEMEFIESKRPRLELLPDPLLRPSPLLAAGQPGGSEDPSKVRPGPGWEPLRDLGASAAALGARQGVGAVGVPGGAQRGPRVGSERRGRDRGWLAGRFLAGGRPAPT